MPIPFTVNSSIAGHSFEFRVYWSGISYVKEKSLDYASNSSWSQTFSYDPFGNISKSGTYTFQPTYNSATNRIASVGGATATYDNNGNATYDTIHNYIWDADGHALTVDNAVTLTYDAQGRMVEQQRGSTYTQIVYSPIGHKLALMNSSTLQKAMVPLSGKAFAIYNSGGLLYYAHPDLLGSIRLATTPSRAMYFDTAYAPFGETYASTGTLDPAYTGQTNDTGQRQDTAGGLYDFPAREYSVQGRWPSPDPSGLAADNPKNPQTLNRYAYVENNPLSHIDPNGTCSSDNPNCGYCDPQTDPLCSPPPVVGGGLNPGGGQGDWPSAIWYPVPLFPPGLFGVLESQGSNVLETGQANCQCRSLSLRAKPPRPLAHYICTYICDCDKPGEPYPHTNILTALNFSQLLVQHVKQYGKTCTYCPTNAKGKFGYIVEQIRVPLFFFEIDFDETIITPIYLTYVSETP